MKVAIVAHHSRGAQAWALAEQLGATVFMDPATNGANWNHRHALAWAAEQPERVVVIEDDAQPVPGFLELAAAWCERRPNDLLSFYLGTGRPLQHQWPIRGKLAALAVTGGDSITLQTLIHGVAYSLPTWSVRDVLAAVDPARVIDYAIGEAWQKLTGRKVVYTVPSLVDHADGPSVESSDITDRRKAWRLAETTNGSPEPQTAAFRH